MKKLFEKALNWFIGGLVIIGIIISKVTGDLHRAGKFVSDTYFAVVTPIATYLVRDEISGVQDLWDMFMSFIKLFN